MACSTTGIAANPIATIATASIHERTVILDTPIAWLRQLTFLDHRCNFPPPRHPRVRGTRRRRKALGSGLLEPASSVLHLKLLVDVEHVAVAHPFPDVLEDPVGGEDLAFEDAEVLLQVLALVARVIE